jgi:hypothetical protein
MNRLVPHALYTLVLYALVEALYMYLWKHLTRLCKRDKSIRCTVVLAFSSHVHMYICLYLNALLRESRHKEVWLAGYTVDSLKDMQGRLAFAKLVICTRYACNAVCIRCRVCVHGREDGGVIGKGLTC